jgi:hypothetical protein
MTEAVRARVIAATDADVTPRQAPVPEPVQESSPTAPVRSREISYEAFGVEYVHRILHKDRILRLVNEVLGDRIELGPIGAGPGRSFASVSVVGTYRPTKGEQIPGDLLAYKVYLPISVVFDLDMRVDRHRFNADVVVPLTLSVRVESPLTICIDIGIPGEDEIALTLQTPTRRGTLLQKLAGLESELKRFLVKVVRTELAKPYVKRATRLDMIDLIDDAWPHIAASFLPSGPEDRQS